MQGSQDIDSFLKGGYLTEAVTISTILTSIGSIFTSAMSWAGTVGSTIAGTPLLLLFVVVPLVGLGVGLFKRLLSMR